MQQYHVPAGVLHTLLRLLLFSMMSLTNAVSPKHICMRMCAVQVTLVWRHTCRMLVSCLAAAVLVLQTRRLCQEAAMLLW